MPSDRTRARRLDFESLFNFRDLGGYPIGSTDRTTRWHVIYRADGIQRATPSDIDRMESIGIRSVVDLRTTHERHEDGSFDESHDTIDYRHIPIFESLTDDERNRPDVRVPETLSELYASMLRSRAPRLAAAVTAVAEAEHAVVFHCTAGKDRTGVVTALMLSWVGVADEVIAHDYAMSAAAMQQLVAWYRANRPPREGREAPLQTEAAMRMLGAEPEWIVEALDLVRDEHGSIEAYLRHAGVTDETLRALHAKLVE